ncbi:sulfotransferase family 2 domain-containing protein [Prochlorococcus marinus]|uniref:sulfotransferase family 2 domain-containing protein n=1 Tax=Prochlorococcus marinus TaxID=1219 RepID=UPI0022B328B5|nr:sulfotransferase family 2 domain-containing protein [Prochlorococcus marinus]
MPIYQLEDRGVENKLTFFHVHIPKTAGTMLEHFFHSIGLRHYGAGPEYMFARPYLKCPPNHYDMKILEQLFFFEKLYSFAIVREPVKRFFSQYQWAISNKCKGHAYFERMTFEDFVIDSFEKYSSDEYYLANYIKPQHHFIPEKVNRIFKIEDGLENAIRTVFNDLQIKIKSRNKETDVEILDDGWKFPRTWTSKPYNKDLVNDNTVKLIKEFYKEDYEKFGYEL